MCARGSMQSSQTLRRNRRLFASLDRLSFRHVHGRGIREGQITHRYKYTSARSTNDMHERPTTTAEKKIAMIRKGRDERMRALLHVCIACAQWKMKWICARAKSALKPSDERQLIHSRSIRPVCLCFSVCLPILLLHFFSSFCRVSCVAMPSA